ncbi:MAG: hypothetical protein ACRYF3_01265 [Janthinobacterium lividum]
MGHENHDTTRTTLRQARKRKQFTVSTAAIAFAVAGLTGLGAIAAQAGTGRAVFTSTIPTVPTVTATMMTNVNQNARVADRDNGASAKLDGKSYWIFADTTLKNAWSFYSSTAAVTTDTNAEDGIDLLSGNAFSTATSAPVGLIPHTAAETAFEKAHDKGLTKCTAATDPYCGVTFAYWPGQVFADTVNDRIVFSYGKICRGGADGTPCSGFVGKGIGTGYAAIDPATNTVTRLGAVNRPSPVSSIEGTDSTLLFAQGESVYTGRNVIKGELYSNGGCSPTCRTAKVSLGQITDYAAYRYWDGSTWNADASKAARIGAVNGNAGHSLFYSEAIHSWVNMYLDLYSNKVEYQVAGQPMGPFSPSKVAFEVPQGNGTTYGLMVHTEYAKKKGGVQFVSWYDNKSGGQGLAKVELTLPAATPTATGSATTPAAAGTATTPAATGTGTTPAPKSTATTSAPVSTATAAAPKSTATAAAPKSTATIPVSTATAVAPVSVATATAAPVLATAAN